MKEQRNKTDKKGSALLVVLFVVMVVTVLSLGFLSQSDVELACGENMLLRVQMDYLAESGLEHAKGLILNPQDVDFEYWIGAERMQIITGSDDYYDVNVIKLGECNYQITSSAYRERSGEKVGLSTLKAEVRFDPCIALRTGTQWTSEPLTTINGDVYCEGNLIGSADINGDGFSTGYISATNIQGRKNEYVSQPPVGLPGLEAGDFSSDYYIEYNGYSVHIVDSNTHPGGSFIPTEGNPAGVRYCTGDVKVGSGVSIQGMLVVNGTLKITGANNSISAVKNFPALIVNGELVMETGATLEVNGLAQIGQRILVNGANVEIDVEGSVFIVQGNIDGAEENSANIEITAAPDKAAIQIWPTPGNPVRWSPAAGAFFRSIERN